MRLSVRKATQALNKAYARQSISHESIEQFRQALIRLFARTDEDEPERHQQQILTDFLTETFYQGDAWTVEGREQSGLTIRSATEPPTRPGVLITVRKVFAGEMMTTLKNNVKSLHELILRYFEVKERDDDAVIHHLVITDVYNWFVFDESAFQRAFYDNARLRRLHQLKIQQGKSDPFFYAEAARILREMDDEVPVTCLNLREVAAMAKTGEGDALRPLIPVYKLFSPEHLLRQPFAHNANMLQESFVAELLHIVGIETVTTKAGNRFDRLPHDRRLPGTLLEQTITGLLQPAGEGQPAEKVVVDTALGLCLTWLARLLLLKTAEAQAIGQAPNGRREPFLTPRHIRSFGELNELFLSVVATPETKRSANVLNRFGPVPYLPIALFRPTTLEQQTLTIDRLDARKVLPLSAQTVLQSHNGAAGPSEPLPALQYLLAFLDAYSFRADDMAHIEPDNKPPLDPTRLGLILEKLASYRTGVGYTPGDVTMQVAREAVRPAVVARFNQQFGWHCTDVQALREQLEQVGLAEATAVFDSLRLVDPAMGSGRYLVSALNELIALKAELDLLADAKGRPLSHYTLTVANDELLVTNADGEVATDGLVHEAIGRERQRMLRDNLFGVDRDPVAVALCQARLTMELLRSGSRPMELPTLRVGHALIARVDVTFRPETIRNVGLRDRLLTSLHQHRQGRAGEAVEELMRQVVLTDRKLHAEIRQLEARLAQAVPTFDFVDDEARLLPLREQLETLRAAFRQKEQVYDQAIEWRFTFPELLDEAGSFVGFDIVLGRPPVGTIIADKEQKALLKKLFPGTYAPKADTAALFVDLGMRLLRLGGQLAYVLPGGWLDTNAGAKLNAWLEQNQAEGQLGQRTELATEPGPASGGYVLRVTKSSASFPPGERPSDRQ